MREKRRRRGQISPVRSSQLTTVMVVDYPTSRLSTTTTDSQRKPNLGMLTDHQGYPTTPHPTTMTTLLHLATTLGHIRHTLGAFLLPHTTTRLMVVVTSHLVLTLQLSLRLILVSRLVIICHCLQATMCSFSVSMLAFQLEKSIVPFKHMTAILEAS